MEIHRYESLSSTNSELFELSKKNAKSWTVIWTSHQTEGKGYSGNTWISEPGKNIAVSVLIKSDLNYAELIYFNQWVCNVISDFLSTYTDEVSVKWPNDIIIKNKKVCGVLIETHKIDNQINIITGIGLNVNQTNFDLLPKAGSLATQTQEKYQLEEILSGLLTELEKSYYLVENKDWKTISLDYNKHLFLLNQTSEFIRNGELIGGIIRGVNDEGQLEIEINQKIHHFKHKEIELKY